MLNFKVIAQAKGDESSMRITYYQDSNGVVTIHLETKRRKCWVNLDDTPFLAPAYEQLEFMGIIEILRFLKILGYTITFARRK